MAQCFKILIVTIPRLVDRLIKVNRILSAEGIESEIVYGCDAKNTEDLKLINKRRLTTNLLYEMSDSEIGCQIGHLKALSIAAAGNSFKNYIVIEDDAMLCDDFRLRINEFQKAINTTVNDIFVLGGQEGLNSIKWIRWGAKHKSDKSFYDVTPSASFVFRTVGYAVTSTSAKKIVEIFKSNTFLADDYYFVANKGLTSIWLTKRSIIIHPSDLSSSEIQRGGINAKVGFPRKIQKSLILLLIKFTQILPDHVALRILNKLNKKIRKIVMTRNA
jgi:GR25 family glycosyltransferase involved in LPS biosynthesis